MDGREPGRVLTFVDLAVPRDVEPLVGELPAVKVYNLDALQQRLNGNLADRRQEVPLVEAIIEEEMTLFQAWRHGAELRPVLAAMHTRGEAIRRQETERALRRLGGTDPEVLVATCDRALIEDTRRNWPFLRDRRIDAYAPITQRWLGGA